MDDEIVIVKLTKEREEILEEIIKEREAYSTLTRKLKSWWIFGLGAGVLTLFSLWESIKPFFIKVQ